VVGVYLNTPQDVEAFCTVANVKLADLPYYEGDGTIERGKGPKTDKYVFKLQRPIKMIGFLSGICWRCITAWWGWGNHCGHCRCCR